MIVRILSRGKSFKGLATYLTHDAKAKTDERVAWTHTFNLANDHVPSAVDEMLATARNAELLKQEAGIRAGGRTTENSVKHLSLNWAPDDNPTREHMIDATGQFLQHMKWHEHQAIVVAHDDKAYAHVHVMLNVVHPETGLRLDDNFERRRAQAWALEYEREQGRIHCEQRLRNPAERENAPPRNIWMAFHENEKEFSRTENALRDNAPIFVAEPKNRNNEEWEILKGIQRAERTEFFAGGKIEFSQLRLSIYREIREEFRERWRDFFALEKDDTNPETLAARKAEIVAEQKAVLEERRDEACAELRQARDQRYRGLLDDQREARAELGWRQEAGLDNALFLNTFADRDDRQQVVSDFRAAADEALSPHSHRDGYATTFRETSASEDAGTEAQGHRDNDGIDVKIAPGIGSIIDGLFSALINLGSGPTVVRRSPREEFEAAAQETLKQQEREREEAEAWERRRQRSFHGD
jgi:hypothetical protein